MIVTHLCSGHVLRYFGLAIPCSNSECFTTKRDYSESWWIVFEKFHHGHVHGVTFVVLPCSIVKRLTTRTIVGMHFLSASEMFAGFECPHQFIGFFRSGEVVCLIDSSDPPHLPFPQNHAKREPMVLCELCKRFPLMEKAKKATDVGLEPTASALGGLRATIAPTGQLLVVEEIVVFVHYIPRNFSLCKKLHEATSSILTVIVLSKISRPSSALDIRTFHDREGLTLTIRQVGL